MPSVTGDALFIGHAVLIGIVAGLRTMIAPTAVAYARGSLWWILFAAFALGELIGDKLPKSPARTIPAALILRCIAGGGSAYFLAGAGAGAGALLAAVCGVVGALIGTYGGYALRHALTRPGRLPDLPVAIGEDILTIALAFVAIRG
jgi:uncharacterized membrane protein